MSPGSSLGQRVSEVSTCFHMTDVYQYSKVLATFTVISIVCLLFSCTGKPSTGSSIPGRVSHCWGERKDHKLGLFVTLVLMKFQTPDTVRFPHGRGTLLTHGQSSIYQDLLLQSYFPASWLPVFIAECNCSLPDKDFAFHSYKFMEFLESHFCSEVSRSLWMVTRTTDVISHSSWFCIFSK